MLNDVFDEATLSMLTDVVSKTWEALPLERQQATSKDEIARLVMLIAMSGNLDPDDIMNVILSDADNFVISDNS